MASANTPDPPNPIDILDIRRVFGNGNNQTPGDDLNDYHGVAYFETFYPYRAAKFSSSNNPLSFDDFYSKTSVDPAIPGSFEDYTPGSRTFKIPPFRVNVVVELWGAGGGGSGGNHDYTPASGASGGSSSMVVSKNNGNFNATVTGGGGGTGGYRYGNQNGSGGGGGTVSQSGNTSGCVVISSNGNSGSNGDAGNGVGGDGANSPYYTTLTKTYEMFLADNPSISLSTFNTVLSYYATATPRTFVNSGTTIKYYSLNRKPDYSGLRYWCLQYQSDAANFTKNFYYGIGTSDNQYLDFKYSRAPRPTLLTNGTSSDFIDTSIKGGTGGAAAGPGNQRGGNGSVPGAGGGGGGYSDFQSGKNANPNRSAGGGGGSGSYVKITVPRSLIPPGMILSYTLGAGGAGLTQSGGAAQGQGGNGAAGGIRITWT
jgi:hypothetical protein